jgi:hypothetical protein
MEWDVTVHKPGPRIVGFKRENEITARGKSSGITTWRVVQFESRKIALPRCVSLGIEHKEVVAMKMDGMREIGLYAFGFLNDPVLKLKCCWLSLRGRWKLLGSYLLSFFDQENIFSRVGTLVSIIDLVKSRSTEIDFHRTPIDEPLHKTGLESSRSKAQRHLLRHLIRDFRRHVRNDVGLIIASLGERRIGHRFRILFVLSIRAFVAKDAPDVSSVAVRAVADPSTCTHSEPVVAGGLCCFYNDIIPLAYASNSIYQQVYDWSEEVV